MKDNKLYIFKDSIPDLVPSFKGRLFIVKSESKENNAIDVLMLDDYTEWCFTYHEFCYYCEEVKKCP